MQIIEWYMTSTAFEHQGGTPIDSVCSHSCDRGASIGSTSPRPNFSMEDKSHNLRFDVVDVASTTDITWHVKLVAGSGC